MCLTADVRDLNGFTRKHFTVHLGHGFCWPSGVYGLGLLGFGVEGFWWCVGLDDLHFGFRWVYFFPTLIYGSLPELASL